MSETSVGVDVSGLRSRERMQPVTFRLEADIRDDLVYLAADRNEALGALLRDVVRDYVCAAYGAAFAVRASAQAHAASAASREESSKQAVVQKGSARRPRQAKA